MLNLKLVCTIVESIPTVAVDDDGSRNTDQALQNNSYSCSKFKMSTAIVECIICMFTLLSYFSVQRMKPLSVILDIKHELSICESERVFEVTLNTVNNGFTNSICV